MSRRRATPFEVCEQARAWLRADFGGEGTRVRVIHDGGVLVGKLKKVSPVNAWIQVDGHRIPADVVTRLERRP